MVLLGPAASLVFEIALEALAPSRCAACDARVRWLTAFCAPCALTAEPGHEGSGGALVYAGAVAAAIVRMKYGARPDLARPLGDLLWRSFEARAAPWRGGVVVPVPLHPARLAERGFNQSALLARRVVRRLDARFAPRGLARTRDTPRQAALDRAARATNLAGAFRVPDPAVVREQRVLLVDDVATTGATLAACTLALLDAGAASVGRAVVAVAAQRVVKSGAANAGIGG
jgi:ComF family protein